MAAEVGFVVVAGKYEDQGEKNVKVVTAPTASFEEALKEYHSCRGLHFIEMEYQAADGKTYKIEFSE